MSWDPPLPYALLLEDDGGQNDKSTNDKVIRGSLLAKLSPDEVRGLKQNQPPGSPPFNFKYLEDPSNKLFCTIHSVFLLNDKHKEFLQGIDNISERFDALNKLQWAEKLTEGAIVYVTIPAFLTAAKAIIHYIGNLPGETGIKFGIELLVCICYVLLNVVQWNLS